MALVEELEEHLVERMQLLDVFDSHLTMARKSALSQEGQDSDKVGEQALSHLAVGLEVG